MSHFFPSTFVASALLLICAQSASALQEPFYALFPSKLSDIIDQDALRIQRYQKNPFKTASTRLTRKNRAQPKKASAPSKRVMPKTNHGFWTVMMFPANDNLRLESRSGSALGNSRPPVSGARHNFSSNTYRVPLPLKLASSPTSAKYRPRKPEPLEPQRIPASTDRALSLSVVGPEFLVQGTPDEYELIVENMSPQASDEIIVQMEVSEDLTITNMDRKAWLDQSNRTVSWKIPPMESKAKVVIRFRAVSASPGHYLQKIVMGMGNSFQGQASFTTHVVAGTNAVPRPPFESKE